MKNYLYSLLLAALLASATHTVPQGPPVGPGSSAPCPTNADFPSPPVPICGEDYILNWECVDYCKGIYSTTRSNLVGDACAQIKTLQQNMQATVKAAFNAYHSGSINAQQYYDQLGSAMTTFQQFYWSVTTDLAGNMQSAQDQCSACMQQCCEQQ